MEDPILKSYLNEFSKSFCLDGLRQSEVFEYFAAYCVLHRDFSEHAELTEAVVAGGQDTGIDIFAAFINDIQVNTPAQLKEISEKQRLDVDFCFIQAKTSRSISAAEVGSFLQGVKEFFGNRYMPHNESIEDKRDLCDRIFDNSVKFKSKPRLNLFYCYAGNYKNDPVVNSRVEAAKNELGELNLFSSIKFDFIDSDRLQERYQEVNLRIDREVQINEFASLPPIRGIRQAYIGVIPCLELVKLLSNSDGKLHKALFNENVRDFLSSNPVNDEIAETVSSPELQSRLAALNNGITIVARSISLVGKKFTLSDFQIVNGCQTSHIVFANQDKLLPDTALPLKLIEVEDREIVNEIVRATNRQTEVKDEAFVVLAEFHKKLERFFLSIDEVPSKKIVYERRKRQYADSSYTSNNIVTITFLTNAFVSCCLDNPVDAIDYYGVNIARHSERIYDDSHSLWPYLLSAKILREVEKLCVGSAKRSLWKFRFIIAMLVRRSFGKLPPLSSDGSQKKYTEIALRVVSDPEEFVKRVSDAEKVLAAAILREGGDYDTRNAHQDRRLVAGLLK